MAKTDSNPGRTTRKLEGRSARNQVVAGLFPSQRSFDVFLGLVLALAVLWTFFPAIQNGFVDYDDPDYVSANLHVQKGLTWDGVKWAFSNSETGNWHPLTWMSHMLDCELFGLNPSSHHLVSVLLHAFSTVLVFLLFKRMTGAVGASFLLAALFGLHPLRVESVAWIAERKDVLSTVFWMLTLLAYVNFAQRRETDRLKSRCWYWLSLGFFLLGLLSKSMLVTVPCVLLLLDYWPLERWSRDKAGRLLLEKIPFFFLTLLFSVVTFVAQRNRGAVELTQHLPWSNRLENTVVSYMGYLAKLFYPADLCVFYPRSLHWKTGLVLVSGLLLGVITAMTLVVLRKRRYALTGWLWFLGTLVPVIGIVQVGSQAMADRYTYVPSLGVLMVLVWGTFDLIHRSSQRRAIMVAVFVPIIAVCIHLTRRQITYWKDTESLFRHAVAVTENNFVAHNYLGIVFERQGHLNEALEQYRAALNANPEFAAFFHNNMGVVLQKGGRPDEAIVEYQEALKLQPGYPDAHANLGLALSEKGDFDTAVAECRRALELKPGYVAGYYQLGVVYGRMGKYDEAIKAFRQMLELQPSSADAHYSLGVTYFKTGALDEAAREYRETLQRNPNHVDAHFNLGYVAATQGRLEEAIREYQEVLRINPNYPGAADNLNALMEIERTGQKK